MGGKHRGTPASPGSERAGVSLQALASDEQ